MYSHKATWNTICYHCYVIHVSHLEQNYVCNCMLLQHGFIIDDQWLDIFLYFVYYIFYLFVH